MHYFFITHIPSSLDSTKLPREYMILIMCNFVFLCSYFSPLLKSITSRPDVDYIKGEEEIERRDDFIAQLEARFLFLAADARHTLRLRNCVQSRISI